MEILRLHAEGLSLSEVARRAGHDRKTVRAVLKRGGTPLPTKRRGGGTRFSKLEPFKDYLDRRLSHRVFNTVVLLDEIRKQGYTGGRTVLKEYVQPFRPKTRGGIVPVIRFETDPGKQSQVDFFDIKFHFPDGRTWKVYLFLYTLAYSRLLWGRFFPGEGRVYFLRGLDGAFRATGGVTGEVLHDRLPAAVIGRDDNGQPIYAPEFLAFAGHHGFTPHACKPRRAQTKGKIERPGSYVQENFLPRTVGTLHEADIHLLNRMFQHWLDTTANVRIHGTTHERPLDRFLQDEAGVLKPVSPASFGLDEVKTRGVSRDRFIQWKTCRYEVPWTLVGRDVLVRETPEGDLHVEFDGRTHVTYRLSDKPNAVVENHGIRQGLWEAALGRTGVFLPHAPSVDERPLSDYEILAGVRD